MNTTCPSFQHLLSYPVSLIKLFSHQKQPEKTGIVPSFILILPILLWILFGIFISPTLCQILDLSDIFYILRIMISDVKKQQVRSILLFVWTVIMASLATGEFYNVDSQYCVSFYFENILSFQFKSVAHFQRKQIFMTPLRSIIGSISPKISKGV